MIASIAPANDFWAVCQSRKGCFDCKIKALINKLINTLEHDFTRANFSAP